IGDYLSRNEKLKIVDTVKDISGLDWRQIVPDANHDWTNQRDPNYIKYLPIGNKKDKAVFYISSVGVMTSRDSWVNGFSHKKVRDNSYKLINNYESELARLANASGNEKLHLVNRDSEFIKW
ncbi:type ISP restriction/modification enzyme, partial [Streptomyces scabiei]|uniref:type ISP restriction/modification enzyme n=1 Tax=Streptomyces scabiei TaxID=1930 RepID=UPI0038F7018B